MIVDHLIAVFDPLMRETLELRRLNRIWEDFNKNRDAKKTQMSLLREKWRYNTERAHLLLTLTYLLKAENLNG